MKKTLSLVLALVMVLCSMAVLVSADEDFDMPWDAATAEDIGIMNINDVSYEGVTGLYLPGYEYSGAWRNVAVLEYDEEKDAFKVTQVVLSSGTSFSYTVGENEIIVDSNTGNDWPALFATANGTEWFYNDAGFHGIPYSECPNFVNDKNTTWMNNIGAMAVGDYYTLFPGFIIFEDEFLTVANYSVDAEFGYLNDDYTTYCYLKKGDIDVPEWDPFVETDETENVAEGKPYTVVGIYPNAATASYPDAGGELTDGAYAAKDNFYDAGWVGLNVSADDIKDKEEKLSSVTVDLGEVTAIDVIALHVLNDEGAASAGIKAPKKVNFSVSNDGETWTDLGDTDVINTIEDTNYLAINAEGAEARFVKATITHNSNWCFISEIEVYAAAEGGEEDPQTWEIFDDLDVEDFIEVNTDNGILQNDKEGTFDYTYATVMGEDAMYIIVVPEYVPMATPDGQTTGNGNGTNVRLWFHTNDEATVYTHFIDLFYRGEFEGAAYGKKCGQLHKNADTTEIDVSTVEVEALNIDGLLVLQAKIPYNVIEAGDEFGYFVTVSNGGENNNALLYPKADTLPATTNDGTPIDATKPTSYFPYTAWNNAAIVVNNGTTPPPTSDAGLIALAVISAIALGGAVILGKRK